MNMEFLGCIARRTPLAALMGVEATVECTVSGNPPQSIDEAATLLSKLIDYVSQGFGVSLRPAGRVRWEGLGKGRYRLYTVQVGGEITGQARIIVAEWLSKPLAGIVVLYKLGGKLDTEEEVEWGSPLRGMIPAPWEPVEEVSVMQKESPKLIVYKAEHREPTHPGYLSVESPEAGFTISLRELEERAEWKILDFHCVTGWSYSGKRWLVVPLSELLDVVGGCPGGWWLTAISSTGYTTVLPCLEAVKAYVALGLEGEKLGKEHGGPVRLLAPSLFGWKHAKWLTTVRVVREYVDGFWEAHGYHERGLWRLDERFKIRNPDLLR